MLYLSLLPSLGVGLHLATDLRSPWTPARETRRGWARGEGVVDVAVAVRRIQKKERETAKVVARGSEVEDETGGDGYTAGHLHQHEHEAYLSNLRQGGTKATGEGEMSERLCGGFGTCQSTQGNNQSIMLIMLGKNWIVGEKRTSPLENLENGGLGTARQPLLSTGLQRS